MSQYSSSSLRWSGSARDLTADSVGGQRGRPGRGYAQCRGSGCSGRACRRRGAARRAGWPAPCLGGGEAGHERASRGGSAWHAWQLAPLVPGAVHQATPSLVPPHRSPLSAAKPVAASPSSPSAAIHRAFPGAPCPPSCPRGAPAALAPGNRPSQARTAGPKIAPLRPRPRPRSRPQSAPRPRGQAAPLPVPLRIQATLVGARAGKSCLRRPLRRLPLCPSMPGRTTVAIAPAPFTLRCLC